MAGDQIPANSAERLAALRQQRQALEAEIDEVTRLIELEAQREALLKEQTLVADRASRGVEGSADTRRAAQGERGEHEAYNK